MFTPIYFMVLVICFFLVSGHHYNLLSYLPSVHLLAILVDCIHIISTAFYSTLRAIIYVRSLGLDKLTNAFGLTALAMGLGVFIGTTAGGILNDLTGDYTASFAFAGICIIVAGALKLLLPYLMRRVAAVRK